MSHLKLYEIKRILHLDSTELIMNDRDFTELNPLGNLPDTECSKVLNLRKGSEKEFLQRVLSESTPRHSQILETKFPCWCTCILALLLLSHKNFIIMLKMDRLSKTDSKILHILYSELKKSVLFKKCLASLFGENSTCCCSPSHFLEVLFDQVSGGIGEVKKTPMLNCFKVGQLLTYYCSDCKFQQIFKKKDGPLFIRKPCYYISPTLIKFGWFCPNCQSEASKKSICEIKVNIPDWYTVFIVFTESGLDDGRVLRRAASPTDGINEIITGSFRLKYIIYDSSGSIRIHHVKSNDVYSLPMPKEIRALIWHHSNPSSRICRSSVAEKILNSLSQISKVGPSPISCLNSKSKSNEILNKPTTYENRISNPFPVQDENKEPTAENGYDFEELDEFLTKSLSKKI